MKKHKIQYSLLSLPNYFSGGMTMKETLAFLRANGVLPCKRTTSPYVGHYSILVPKVLEKQARKLLFH